MDRFVILLAPLLVLVAVGSHAPLPAEVYWQKVLPNVPMPSAILDLLHPGRISVNVNPGKLKNGFPNLANNKYYGQYAGNLANNKYYGQYAGNLANNKYYGQYAGNLANNKYYGQYAGNLANNKYYGQYAGNLANNKYYGQYGGNLANNKYYGQYAGNLANNKYYGKYSNGIKKSHHHFHNDSSMSLFFLEKDLQPGAMKSMLFVRNIIRSTFIPRQEADSLPFSSAKLPEILNHFSIKPDTVEAANIRTTLNECEMPEFQGEHKFCATSLESLVESSMSALGTRSIQAVSTAVSNEGTPKQPYTVAASGLKRLPGSDTVACHSSLYPYVVYYCHSIKGTRAYRVSLIGKSETKVDAVAVCHTETNNWNPEHIAFQVLNVKPGAVICHILPQDNLLWTPTK